MMLLDGVKVALLVFAAVVLQVSAVPQLTPTDSTPDLIVILVAGLAMLRGVEVAALAGFAGGLLLDAVSAQHMGLSSLLYVLAAWAISRAVAGEEDTALPVGPRLVSPARQVAITALAALGVQVAYALLQWLIGEGFPVRFVIGEVILPTLIMTTIAAVLLLPVLRWLFPYRARFDAARTAAA